MSPAASSAFELLGLAPQFALRKEDLEATHRELAKTLHPDRHRDRPAGERRLLLERAMKVNEAYRLLRDPVRRAIAVLELSGHVHDAERQASPPPEFLMDVMEERETLAEAAAARNLDKVERLIELVRTRQAGTEQQLAGALDSGLPPDVERVLPLIATLRYDARFLEEARSIAEDLGA